MRVVKCEQSFDGIRVRYFVYTPRGEVVRRAAFVCSMLGDSKCWDRLCSKLCASGVLCVTIELPGFGTTPVKAPQDNITRARIFWGILDDVEESRHESGCAWHLVSHGSACGAILEMTCMEPKSVLSRTLISPVTDRFTDRFTGLLPTTGLGQRLIKLWYGFAAENRSRFDKKVGALYGTELTESRLSLLYREFVRRGRVNTLINLFENGYKITRKAFKAQTRIMIISGSRDRVFGSKLSEKYTHDMPEIEIHLLPCAHMAMETNPDEVYDYLSGWFEFTEGKMKQPKRT